MSTKPVRSIPGTTQIEVIRGFDSEKLKAPFVLRCGALMIDYIGILLIPVLGLILGRLRDYDGARLLNSELNNAGWLIAILFVLTNVFIFPLISGQSIGKMITGLRIVNSDGSTPGVRAIIMRHLVGYPFTVFSGMLGFLMSVFHPSGKALHDHLAGTVVVYGSAETSTRTKVIKKRTLSAKGKKDSIAEGASAGRNK